MLYTDEGCKREESAKQNSAQRVPLGVRKGNETLAQDADKEKEKCNVTEATTKKRFQREDH